MAEMLEGDPFFNSRSFTAAKPGPNGYAETAAELYREAAAGYNDATSIIGAPVAGLIGAFGTERGRRLTSAAYEATRLNDQSLAERRAIEQAIDHRIDIVREQTGALLENPLRGGYRRDAQERARRAAFEGGAEPVSGLRRALDIFNEQVNLAAERHPDKAAALTFGQSIEDQAVAIARAAADENTNASAAVPDGATRITAGLAGGLAGALTDPVQILGLGLGAGPAVGRSVAVNIGRVALTEAAINGGLQAIEEPAVQAWRQRLGLESGLEPAIENIALASLLGAGFGAGAQGLREVFKGADLAAIRKVFDGTATIEDTERALRAAKIELPAEQKQALAAARAIEADAAATAPQVKAEPEAHAEAAQAAARNAADPDANPPAIAPIEPARKPRLDPAPDLRDEGAALGRFTMMGRPIDEIRVDPVNLETDAQTFQYKEASDAAGVTDRLAGVQAIAPLSTGKLVVFERADGTLVVADGHQRTGLFKRLADDAGEVPIAVAPGVTDRGRVDVPAFRLREADGWTPGDVRAIAAIKNIQEGSGSLMDTARVLRDRPDLFDATISVARGQTQQAAGLAALSDDAWRMVTNGLIEPHIASLVGRIAPERAELHVGLLGDLIDQKPANVTEAQFAIRDALAAGTHREVQETLFGQLEATRTLLAERRQVYAGAIKRLKSDKGVFALLNREAQTIEGAGNRLDKASNATTAQLLDELTAALEKVATRAGPVSDMLNARAAMVAEGMPVSRAATEFAADVIEKLKTEGRGWLYQEPRLSVEKPIEPGSKEAADVVDAYTASDLEQAGQGNMFGEAPATEKTVAGEQALIPGVKPVTDAERARIEAAKPLTGGDAPAGGLFDDVARNQLDLTDAIKAVDDAGARFDFMADLTASCKG